MIRKLIIGLILIAGCGFKDATVIYSQYAAPSVTTPEASPSPSCDEDQDCELALDGVYIKRTGNHLKLYLNNKCVGKHLKVVDNNLEVED